VTECVAIALCKRAAAPRTFVDQPPLETRTSDPTLRRMTTTARDIVGDEIIIQGFATASRKPIGQARLCAVNRSGKNYARISWTSIFDKLAVRPCVFRVPAIAWRLPHARENATTRQCYAACVDRHLGSISYRVGFSKAELTPRQRLPLDANTYAASSLAGFRLGNVLLPVKRRSWNAARGDLRPHRVTEQRAADLTLLIKDTRLADRFAALTIQSRSPAL
jgi:hypothetical protein